MAAVVRLGRVAIRAAGPGQMRRVLTGITSYLCDYLHDDTAPVPALAPGRRQLSGVCQAGPAMRAGFRLYHSLTRVVAGHYLHALGLDPPAPPPRLATPPASGQTWTPPPTLPVRHRRREQRHCGHRCGHGPRQRPG